MKFTQRTSFWIILFAVLLLLAAAGLFVVGNFGPAGMLAVVRLDGELFETIDLRAVTIPYEQEIVTELGVNTLRVEPGRIAVISADCPDQVCVHQGFVDSGLIPIVCLPHRLTIQLEESR